MRKPKDIPIYGDVRRGRGGIAGGKFVMNDGEGNPWDGFVLQEDGTPLLQESSGQEIELEA